ncbi:MAG: hypothetical protein KGN84_13570 [Acidobacteriota bacterium]|nr:hypothetical protein [Acidobacteriota bacterium]
MATSFGQTGTADSVHAGYFTWESDDRRILVRLNRDAMAALARDIAENQAPADETGGVLLGHVGCGERAVVWIERFQPVPIEHSSGAPFALSPGEYDTFERAAREIAREGELTVTGLYRTHLRPGLHLEGPDFELAKRYFSDAEDLFLVLKPMPPQGISAQFFGGQAHDGGGAAQPKPLGPAFPFQNQASLRKEDSEAAGDETCERTAQTIAPPAPRRLVPDFQPAIDPGKPREFSFTPSEPDLDAPGFFHRRWPLFAALILVSAAAGFVWRQTVSRSGSASPAATADTRPLGLYVDPSGSNWRISWNQTALRNAHDVRLFVRDGPGEEHVVTARDLQSGTYDYRPQNSDVTFRLEATGPAGLMKAESFRVLIQKPPAPPAAPAGNSPPPVFPAPAAVKFMPPKAIHRVPPVVPASIRPRIKSSIPVDVRVSIDARGRVTSAIPVTKAKNSLERLLMGRAVYAARQWRFEPARREGKPTAGAEILHFVFDR